MTGRPPGRLPGGRATTSHDDTFRDDPHQLYDTLRARPEPFVADPDYGRSIATRHAAVRALLRDGRFGVDARRAVDDAYVRRIAGTGVAEGRGDSAYEPPLVLLDDPDHRRIRTLVGRAFNARSIEAERPRVEEVTAQLLDELVQAAQSDASAPVELVSTFATRLPAMVITAVLGLDDADPVDVSRWSEDILWGYDPERGADRQHRLRDAYVAATACVRATVTSRRAEPTEDLISAMVRAHDEHDRLSDLEIISLCIQLMVAGNVTTSDLIGNGVLHLLTHRDQWELLVERPDLVEGAVEELLRFDCPITETARIAYEPVVVDGCPFEPGDTVTLSLSAANHDPAAFPDPHRLDIERDTSGHLAFGSGIHVCLGAPLARIEARAAIGGLARRFPAMCLAEAPAERRRLPFFRGLETLPVVLGPPH